ncbi:MAG: orotidine 5'-phosphate decarboxylase / HUMPS family protein [Candidatus Aenigmatarchaeota archaeon]
MLFEDRVKAAYKEAKSILCVGLDPLPEVIPPSYDLREWAREMINSTYNVALAFKANLSGYVGSGKDLDSLKEICKYAKDKGRLFIVDSKANDVGFTAAEYARRYLKEIDADACTVNALPWLNDVIDSFTPYLDEKGIFVLVYTTSPNSEMFWSLNINEIPMWRFLALKVANEWSQKLPKQDYSPIGIVAGPRDEELACEIRGVCDTQVILAPGLGAQGVPVRVLKYLKKEGISFPGVIGNVGRDIAGEWRKYPEEDPFKVIKKKAEEWDKILKEAIRDGSKI